MRPPLDPMLATIGPLPADESRYAFEPKWDGFRALIHIASGRAHIWSRRGNDLTDRFPELAGLAQAVPSGTILDGELVVLGADGHPDFEAMRWRAFTGQARGQLVFVAFDLLHRAGTPLLPLGYEARRRHLEDLSLAGPAWLTTPSHPGEGSTLFDATRDLGLEGIVAKALRSPYRPGVRTRAWIKTKHWRRGRFVVGGFSPPDPERGRHAALLVGSPDPDGWLRFAGGVTWGFAAGEMDGIRERLRPRSSSPFAGFRGWAGIEHAEPELLVELRFLERTATGLLRHATYEGMPGDDSP